MTDDEPYSGGLTVTTRDEDGTVVVVAAGELDADTSGGFREAVEGAAGASVVVDLAGVTFIDSSGLSALLHVSGVIGDRHGTFSLRTPSAAVLRLLELTGQSSRFL